MLEALPSYLGFSDDDSLLAVGLRNGKVLLFSDSISKEFELITSVQGNEAFEQSAAIRVIFSKNNKMMAVSFLGHPSSNA